MVDRKVRNTVKLDMDIKMGANRIKLVKGSTIYSCVSLVNSSCLFCCVSLFNSKGLSNFFASTVSNLNLNINLIITLSTSKIEMICITKALNGSKDMWF